MINLLYRPMMRVISINLSYQSDKVGLLVIMPYVSVILHPCDSNWFKLSKLFQESPFESRTVFYKILHLILERSQFDDPLVQGLLTVGLGFCSFNSIMITMCLLIH